LAGISAADCAKGGKGGQGKYKWRKAGKYIFEKTGYG
jgi:hypothetical protein